jgi:hypothetical protein
MKANRLAGLRCAAVLLVLVASGCSSVRGLTNRYADRLPGGRQALDSFRESEGEAAGMVSTRGKGMQRMAVDKSGAVLTNGVYLRLIMDEQIVAPYSSGALPAPLLIPAGTIAPVNTGTESTAGGIDDLLEEIGTAKSGSND